MDKIEFAFCGQGNYLIFKDIQCRFSSIKDEGSFS